MTDDGTVQLRRNPSKVAVARNHLTRHGKAKGSSTRLHKPNTRKNGQLQRSQSSASINQLHPTHSNSATGHTQSGENIQVTPRGAKTSRSKVNLPIGVSSVSSYTAHRHRGLNIGHSGLSQSHRKNIIQLERDDDDDDEDYDESNDFEDLDEDTDGDESNTTRRPSSNRSDSQLNIGIQPVEPTPPKLSEETVISVSSIADMASALKGARDKSGFVGSDDLISTAVNRSKNFGEMAQMVQGWNTGKRSSLSTVHSGIGSIRSGSTSSKPRSNPTPGEEDPREFEKVFREYTNTRAINNPVINSIYRLFKATEGAGRLAKSSSPTSSVSSGVTNDYNNDTIGRKNPNWLHLPSGKKVSALVATTTNQMSDFSERDDIFQDKYSNSQNHGVIESVSTYTLNKLWQSGWSELESTTNNEVPPADTAAAAASNGGGDNIHGQAMRVQQQLANNWNRGGPSTIRLS